MHHSLRHLARLPHLRVLALLAWLMLALAPVHGAPGGMMGDAHGMNPPSSTMPMADHMAHDMSAMMADCCTGQAPHNHGTTSDCHCAVTCASVLPVPTMTGLASPSMHVMPFPRHGVMTLSVTRSPPLRPPLLQTPRLT